MIVKYFTGGNTLHSLSRIVLPRHSLGPDSREYVCIDRLPIDIVEKVGGTKVTGLTQQAFAM
jgi:hypothetical protein